MVAAVLQHQIDGALVVQRRKARVAQADGDVHLAGGCSLVGELSVEQVIAVAHVDIQRIKDAALAPTLGHLGGVRRAAERPVVSSHLGRCFRVDLLR